MMTAASPADPNFNLVCSISAALQTTPVMSRLYDPENALSNETARQLIETLERLGVIVTMAPAHSEATLGRSAALQTL